MIMQWEAQSEKVNKQETLVSANQKNHSREIHLNKADWSPKQFETVNPDVLQGLSMKTAVYLVYWD